MNKGFVGALMALLGMGIAWAGNPVLTLRPGDVERVQIELVPDEPSPKLIVYFSKAKLLELQDIISKNYGQPVSFVTNGQVIVEPIIQSQLLYKKRTVTLQFPNVKAALATAEKLVPPAS